MSDGPNDVGVLPFSTEDEHRGMTPIERAPHELKRSHHLGDLSCVKLMERNGNRRCG
jgi:hypothetical protein